MVAEPHPDNRQLIAAVIASLAVAVAMHLVQGRRIRELERKAEQAAATDEVFWSVTDKFYKLESRLR